MSFSSFSTSPAAGGTVRWERNQPPTSPAEPQELEGTGKLPEGKWGNDSQIKEKRKPKRHNPTLPTVGELHPFPPLYRPNAVLFQAPGNRSAPAGPGGWVLTRGCFSPVKVVARNYPCLPVMPLPSSFPSCDVPSGSMARTTWTRVEGQVWAQTFFLLSQAVHGTVPELGILVHNKPFCPLVLLVLNSH